MSGFEPGNDPLFEARPEALADQCCPHNFVARTSRGDFVPGANLGDMLQATPQHVTGGGCSPGKRWGVSGAAPGCPPAPCAWQVRGLAWGRAPGSGPGFDVSDTMAGV